MIDMVDLFNACLYIQDNLDADLSLFFLAQTVGLSRFRFHRVFKAWRGETLHDFVTRMRMERAAFELSYPIPRSSRRSIKAIAFASGYKSLSSFSHAFSSYSQLSPREFRNQALRRRHASARLDPADVGFGPFRISVSMQPERRIAILDPAAGPGEGLSLSALARVADSVPGAGDRFGIELLPNLLARASGEGSLTTKVTRLGCVGITLADWSASALPLRTDRTMPRIAMRLEAGRYAVIDGHGTVAALYRAWRRGFDDWLQRSGECPKAGRVYVRFGAASDAGIALFVPLEEMPATASRESTRRPHAPRGLVAI